MHIHATKRERRRLQSLLRVSLGLTAAYVVVTLAAGLRGHSLALISESGHNLTDLMALGLSFVALRWQSRPATPEKTFGYQRAGVLAAFVNALTLVGIAIWIAVAAVQRLAAPVAVMPKLMMAVAGAGMLMNGAIAAMLWRKSRDVNLRSVFLHMVGDTVSTAAVIAGGAGIFYTGKNWIDPALSLGIAALVLWSAMGVARETLHILLEGTPRGVRVAAVREAMMGVEGVLDVHDLHVWSLGSNSHALASHIKVDDRPVSESEAILERLQEAVRERFHIQHTTIQVEVAECETTHGCTTPPEEESGEHAHAHGHGHRH